MIDTMADDSGNAPEVAEGAESYVAALQTRLVEVEVKLSFAEDLLDSLNSIVIRQQQQIDAMRQELINLRGQVSTHDVDGMPRQLQDELPPHY